MKRSRRFGSISVAVAYILLLVYPRILFSYQVSHRGFEVGADAPIDPSITTVLDAAAERLAQSSINDPKFVHHIYLCNNPWRMALVAPIGRKAFAVTYPVGGNSFFNRTDVRANTVYNGSPRHNRQLLSAVIAHERTHALMMHRYGILRNMQIPAWKREGYCEVIGGSPSFDVEEGKKLIREGLREDSGSFRYFEYYLMVKYLMDVESLDIDQIVDRKVDPAELLGKVRQDIDHL